ncbi:hypothetical protein M9H77_27991 [Catharanthus roseus]|uniref:Uncharacterized protein n=1 Tax=Catharanthus roseus TaxID=4058 RepID=A0ACC0AID3_CATRO|nr:hypothetical protein M9H77_27991 [Catharanthus roseus]
MFRTRPPLSSNRPYTPIPYDPYGSFQALPISYDPYAHTPTLPLCMPGHDWPHGKSKTQMPLNEVSSHGLQLGAQFFENLVSSIPVDLSYSATEYETTDCGNPSSDAGLGRDSMMSKIAGSGQKRPEKLRPPINPTQRKKAKNDSWEQIGPADGGLLDPVLILHTLGTLLVERTILKLWSRFVSLTVIQSDLRITYSGGVINGQELAQVAEEPDSRLSKELKAACYVQYLLGSLFFTYKSGNTIPAKLWPLVKDVRSSGMDILVLSYVCSNDETGSEVLQAIYLEFGWVQYISAHPIRPLEHRRPANNKQYQVKNVFIKALWLEAPSHLLTETWTGVSAVPISHCIDDYMAWFLSHTHPRIQNPERLPRGVQLPTATLISKDVLLDMITHEVD